jgi:hypothetical protein
MHEKENPDKCFSISNLIKMKFKIGIVTQNMRMKKRKRVCCDSIED